ncbi:hypothetical protein [Exiguobacterium mexicanum]|uniref:hypothetical protein n=1 Tax=Exiguobacterium mexicanum TaxID=340146 RepID=UPI0037C0125E
MKRFLFLFVGLIVILTACSPSEAVDSAKFHTYTTYELPLEDKVALGEGEHEIVFVFDYSCRGARSGWRKCCRRLKSAGSTRARRRSKDSHSSC